MRQRGVSPLWLRVTSWPRTAQLPLQSGARALGGRLLSSRALLAAMSAHAPGASSPGRAARTILQRSQLAFIARGLVHRVDIVLIAQLASTSRLGEPDGVPPVPL